MTRDPIRLTLYVAGDTPASDKAIQNLRALCQKSADACRLEVVDTRRDPGAVERARVLVTPTVVKDHPEPARRFVGDMSEADYVKRHLDIDCTPNG